MKGPGKLAMRGAKIAKKLYRGKKQSNVIGQVVQTNSLWNAVRVQVPDLTRDQHLNIYFEINQKLWVANAGTNCSVGDIVRIMAQEEPQSNRVQHEVAEVVFPVGRIVDPITGRRCRGPDFINEDLRRFGPNKTLATGIDKPEGS